MFSRSLYVVKDVKTGDMITEENIRSIRPGLGGHPRYIKKLIGNKFKNNFLKGDRFTEDDIRNYLK
jgi:pseudaminic acid synthase